MSRNYDNWEKLVDAVLRREKDRQLALCESFSSSVFSSRPSFDPEVSAAPSVSNRDSDAGSKSRNVSSVPGSAGQIEAEWIEQYEPGIYITLVALRDGTRDLKRARFSRRRFGEHQAETWWSENREKVYEKYNVRGSDKSSVAGRRSEGGVSPSSQI